jgi:SAM-dependent methyltransferase
MSSEAKYKQLGNGYHWNWAAQGDANAYVAWVKLVVKEFPNAGAGRSLLDVGCGDGYPASLMVQRGYEVTGVDVLPGPLEIAREMVPAAEFTEEYPKEPFDYVLALESIEHMEDIQPLVRAVNFCREYAIVTSPKPGLDPYGVKNFALPDVVEAFPGCEVDLIYEDQEHQMFKIVPRKAYAALHDALNLEPHKAAQAQAAEVFPDHPIPDFDEDVMVPPSKRKKGK